MKRFLGAVGAAVILVLAVPHPAFAGVENVGWFTRNPAASAPEGGIQVANAPDGIVSFGAVSVFETGDEISRATLTLTESGQALNASGATLRACVAAGSFPSRKGTLAEGPKADCASGSVALTRGEGGVWTGDVTSVLQGDKPALAVVPAEGAAVFQLSFGPPDLVVEADSSAGGESGIDSSFDASEFGGTSSGDSSSSDDFDSSGSGSTSGGSSFGTFDSTSTGSNFDTSSFDAVPSTPAAPVEAAPIVEAASPPEVAGETAMPTRRNLAGTTASTTSDGSSGKQFFFFVVTAAVIGSAAGFGRNRLVTARGL